MDINIDSQIVVQTAAQWAADNTVYSAKRILVTSDAYYKGLELTTDQRKFKIADGVQTWSQLNYVPISQSFSAPTNNSSSLQVEDTYAGVQFSGATNYGEVYVSDTDINILHDAKVHIDAPVIELTQSTASRIMATDVNKNIQYLNTATYPNLTELSYLKGVTSSIQTQLNAVAPLTVNSLGAVVDGAASATPNDTDLVMSVDTSVAKKNTWTQIKAFLKTYFDTVYQAAGSYLTSGGALGTPSSGTLTNCTGLPISGVTGYQGYNMVATAYTGLNPADATTYYWGFGSTGNNPASRRVYITKAGTVKAIYGFINCSAGTNEQSTVSFRLNNTTDTTITSTLDLSSNSVPFNSGALSIAVAAGDYFEIKWVTPTWATNPTSVTPFIQIYIE